MTPHSALAVWRVLLKAWPTRARVHAEGATGCVFGCSGGADSMAHDVECERLWPPLFYAFAIRGDPCLVAVVVLAAAPGGPGPSEVSLALCAAYRLVCHVPRGQRAATHDSLRAAVRAVRERAGAR